MNKLWVTVLMVISLALAAGPPVSAQSGVEYGGLVGQNHGVSKLGGSVNQTFGSAKNQGGNHKRSKVKR